MPHVFSKGGLALEQKNRRRYAGSNYGNVLGPIALPKWGGPLVAGLHWQEGAPRQGGQDPLQPGPWNGNG
eukprot:14908047-Alexandrium_andersonii.AAC.1